MRSQASLLCVALLGIATASAAESLTVRVTGTVVSINDSGNVLQNQVSIGQQVTGTYTYERVSYPYDSDWREYNGAYQLSTGGMRLTAGPFVFETDPDALSTSWQPYMAYTHGANDPADRWNGSFRLYSNANKPLPNISGPVWMAIEFYGTAFTDALPNAVPDLAQTNYRRMSLNGQTLDGQWYSIEATIDTAQVGSLAPPPGSTPAEFEVTPGSTTLVRGMQRFDVVLLAPPGTEVLFASAKEGDTPLPLYYPGQCVLGPYLGRQTIFCPDANQALSASGGVRHIDWKLQLNDGRVLTKSVDWTFIQ